MNAMSTLAHKLAPQPPSLPLIGNLLGLQRKGQLQYQIDNWQQYGDIVRLQLGPFTVHMLAHPDYIRHVLIENRQNYGRGRGYQVLKLFTGEGLLTSEGDFWKRQRRLLQPPFTPKAVPLYVPEVTATLTKFLQRWDVYAANGAVIDVQAEMLKLTLQILGRTMFHLDLEEEAADLLAAFTTAITLVGSKITAGLDVPLAVPTPANLRLKRALRTLDQRVYAFIAERQRRPAAYTDLLAQLLSARDPETGESMNLHQVRDEVMTILFAGHETIAQTLTWAWYLLAQHPAVETQLFAELTAKLGGRAPEATELTQLPYTSMVIHEVMRLYPAVWAIPRGANGDDEIAGYHIPAGSMVFPVPYNVHRHPAFWPEPEEFKPERWASAEITQLPDCAYLPFGDGPRACIGRHYALQEALLVIATIAQRYQLQLASGQKVTPHSAITLGPQHGIKLQLKRR